MKLTPEIIDNLPLPATRLDIPDDDQKGLQLRVTPTGAKTFRVRYYVNREARFKTVGRYPTTTLTAARKFARSITGKAAEGVDVVGVEKKAKAETDRQAQENFDALAKEYFADCEIGMHRKKARPKSARVLRAERAVWTTRLSPLIGHRSVHDVRRKEIIDIVRKLTQISASAGRKGNALISQLYSYATKSRDILQAHIAQDIPVQNSEPRERVLTDAEVRTIWDALVNPGKIGSNISTSMTLALRFLMVTCQRSGQAMGMKWSEVDFEERVWKCPAGTMKKRRTHLVPLSDLALEILNEADRMVGGKVYVFESPETGLGLRVDAASRAFGEDRLTGTLKITDAQIHDFRRTGTTGMTGRCGIDRAHAGKVISHVRENGRNDVTGRHYDMWEYLPEKTVALNRWAELLLTIVDPSHKPGNVVPFRAAS